MIIYVFFRLTAFFIATNIIFPNGPPKLFKVAFSLFLSIAIGINVDVNIEINNFYELIRCTAIETANGLVLGYIVNICFYTLKMAGKLIDNQLGLSMASTYDPNTQSQSTIIENLMYFVGIVIFFVVDAHHILIDSIQKSFNLIPIGYSILENNLSYIIHVFTQYFIIGIKLAIPVIIVLILTDLITGIISRSISGLNVMIIGMPLKMLVGIIFLMSALPFILNQIQDMFKGLIDVLEGTLAYSGPIINLISELI